MDITFTPIGVIHTPISEKEEAPIQSSRSTINGMIEVFSEFAEGLDGIEDFSYVYLLYHLNRSDQTLALKVKPFLDDKLRGIFSTRHPDRPNPIGLSIVRIIWRDKNLISFSGADMLDGTPLLDIKPYIPDFDVFSVEKTGWYQNRKYQ